MSVPQVNQTSLSNFVPIAKIGSGSFSSVYKVKRIDDDKIYALKKVKLASLKQKQKQNALNQISILSSLNCENIICYKDAFFDSKLNILCIVMQYANEGDIAKKIENAQKKSEHIEQRQIWKAIKDILKGLGTLHSKAILHRDIKSANIFISENTYKLGDLNVSKIQEYSNKFASTQTGTPNYASPEIWRDQLYDGKSDIWSLGCVIYEMCALRPPFKGRSMPQLFKNIQKGYYEQIPLNYSNTLRQFISICLKKNAKDRYSCEQFLNSQKFSSKLKCNTQFIFNKNRQIQKIKLPYNLKQLNKKLPKSRYSLSLDISKSQSIRLPRSEKTIRPDKNQTIENQFQKLIANGIKQNPIKSSYIQGNNYIKPQKYQKQIKLSLDYKAQYPKNNCIPSIKLQKSTLKPHISYSQRAQSLNIKRQCNKIKTQRRQSSQKNKSVELYQNKYGKIVSSKLLGYKNRIQLPKNNDLSLKNYLNKKSKLSESTVSQKSSLSISKKIQNNMGMIYHGCNQLKKITSAPYLGGNQLPRIRKLMDKISTDTNKKIEQLQNKLGSRKLLMVKY